YDLNGKVIAQYQYTALQDVSGWASKDIVTAANVTVSKTTANLTRFVYNKDGLEIYRIDAEGAVTETQYNELGKVAHVLQYDKVVTLTGEALTADGIKTALTTAKASAQTQSYYYDALGRMVYSMNAAGYVTRNVYNALNQIIQVWDFRVATTLARNSTFAQMNAVYTVSPPAYFIHYMYYDKLGRKVYDLNQHEILTRYRYDELGNLIGKKETTLSYKTVLDLLRTKDAAGNLSARPPASIENYDAGLALLTEAQYRETNYDYFHVGSLFIVSRKLKNIFEEKKVLAEYFLINLYKENGEYLEEEYFFVNLLKKIDCINKIDSKYSEEDGFIDEIYKLVIDEDKAKNEVLFRVDKTFNNIILVHDSLSDVIKKSGCTGVNFIKVDDWKW
ncbi:TPA: RHS repeat protein, partial [Acinetobacter baumannii]|nr:RHS repeat protein [Acinetobacter baumannii]